MMYRPNNGFSLIEVLVTIVILLIGLLGLAGLQARALTSQMESYQRSQALVLLKDMADRIDDNRMNAPSYMTTGLTPAWLGYDGTPPAPCPALTATNRADVDLCEWSNTLKGTAEAQGGTAVGAMIGARGCISQLAASGVGVPGQYLVAVAWQGFNKTTIPSVPCGTGQYGDERLRRVISLPVSIGNLQ